MGFKLSDDDNHLNENNGNDNKETYGMDYNPVELLEPVYHTTVVPKSNSASKNLKTIIFTIGIIGIIIFAVIKLMPQKPVDLDFYLDLSQKDFEEIFDYTFYEDSAMLEKVPISTVDGKKGVTVFSCKEGISFIYKDGKQVGIFVTQEGYSIKNVYVGQDLGKAWKNMNFPNDDGFETVEDLKQNVHPVYFQNRKNKTCLTLITNKKSNSVEGVAYYTELRVIAKGMMIIEE